MDYSLGDIDMDLIMPLDGLLPPTNTPILMSERNSGVTESELMSLQSSSTKRSFDFNTITPLNIPVIPFNISNRSTKSKHNNNNNNNNDYIDNNDNQSQSTTNSNSSLISSESSLNTAQLTQINTRDFTRSAPSNGGFNDYIQNHHSIKNGWDSVVTWNSPNNNNNNQTSTIMEEKQEEQCISMLPTPSFMKSHFFMERPSTDSMQSLFKPGQAAPQSAPNPSLSPSNCMDNIHNNIWNKQMPFAIGYDAWCSPIKSSESSNQSITVHESEIFDGNNNNSNNQSINNNNSNQSNSNNNNNKRKRSLTDLIDMNGPPQRKLRRDSNDHSGYPTVQINYNHTNVNNVNISLPPPVTYGMAHLSGQLPNTNVVSQSQPITPTMMNAMNNIQITMNNNNSNKRGRGRPRKNGQKWNDNCKINKNNKKCKYDGLKKAERERLRRKELKDGYQKLTDILELKPSRSGSALPERSMIIAAACNEIKNLERELFELTMNKDSLCIEKKIQKMKNKNRK